MVSLAGIYPRSNPVVTTRFSIWPDPVCRVRVHACDQTTLSRAESGCILYHFSESVETEGILSHLMIWQYDSVYPRYAASSYVRAFNSNLSLGMLTGASIVET